MVPIRAYFWTVLIATWLTAALKQELYKTWGPVVCFGVCKIRVVIELQSPLAPHKFWGSMRLIKASNVFVLGDSLCIKKRMLIARTFCVSLFASGLNCSCFFTSCGDCAPKLTTALDSAQKTVQGTHALMSIVRPSSFQKNNAKNAMVENMWVGTTFGMRSPR